MFHVIVPHASNDSVNSDYMIDPASQIIALPDSDANRNSARTIAPTSYHATCPTLDANVSRTHKHKSDPMVRLSSPISDANLVPNSTTLSHANHIKHVDNNLTIIIARPIIKNTRTKQAMTLKKN